MNGSVGQKKIIENPLLNEDIYTDVELNTIQFKISGELEKFWSIYRSILLRTKLSGGYLNGDNLFESDLFRVGGLNSLRGFTENQFYTSGYGIANFEFRAMMAQDTYFMVFFDQAVIKDDFGSDIQFPFGTGAGFSFSTNAGIFNFVFAMGKSNDQPFGINYSKIHFGYISRF
jgi:translocation and assembly module TamA